MATRFWVTSGAPPYTPPTRRGAWNVASGEDIQLLGRKPQGSAGTSSINVGATTANRNVLLHRSISAGAVKAGTISGTVNWTIGAKESNVDCNAFFHLHIYVTSGDTDTPRGTLLSDFTGATEFTTTATGATEGAQTVTPVTVQVGDRIVVEIGYQASSLATTYNATINYGNVGSTDLASGDTVVTTEPGWVEFSGADGLFTSSFSTLIDAFPSSIDAKWTKTTNVSATGGRARIPTTTTLEDLYTATAYEIQGSTLAFQVPSVPATGGGSGAFFSAYLSAGPTISTTNLEFTYSPSTGNLMLRNNVGGSDASPTTLTYSSTSHQWWRFKESGGSILMETSPDNVTWTTQRTISTITQWMRLGTLIFYCESQRTSGTADYAEIDNVNPPAAHVIAVTNAAEVDTAQALGKTKAFAVGIAGQTGTAQPLARTKTSAASLASEVDTAQPLGRVKKLALGTASAVATAQLPGRAKRATLPTASAVDTAQAIGRSKTVTVGIAAAIAAAQALARVKARPVSPAQAIEASQALGRAKQLTLSPAAQTSTAQHLGTAKSRPITPAAETDTAQATPRGVPARIFNITVTAVFTNRWTARLTSPRWKAVQRPSRWSGRQSN